MLHGPVVNWISTQHWTSLCTGFFDRENNGEKNEFPLGLACYLIKFGVIFNPLSNELYYSHPRNGVFKNSEKISIDNSILSKSLVAVSLS